MGTYGVKKGAWTNEEDVLLRKCIENYGDGKWHLVPLRAGLNRCRKSCRLRWMNYLRPDIKRGQFTHDEVDLMMRLHKLLGNRWSLIAGRLPGRTANDVKNYWNTHHKDMVSCGKMGIDKVQKQASKWEVKMNSKTEVLKPQPWAFYESPSGWRMKAAAETTTQSPGILSEPIPTLPPPNENDGSSRWWERLLADLEGDDQGTDFICDPKERTSITDNLEDEPGMGDIDTCMVHNWSSLDANLWDLLDA